MLFFPSYTLSQVNLDIGYLEPFSEEFDLKKRVTADHNDSLNLRMTPGEYESIAFYLVSDSDLDLVDVSLTELRKDSDVIAEESFNLKHVGYWYQSGGAWESHRIDRKKESLLIPELLLNDPNLIEVDHSSQINLVSGGGEGKIRLEGDVLDQRQSLEGVAIRDSKKLLPTSLEANTPHHYFLTIQAPGDAVPGIYSGHVAVVSGSIKRRFDIAIEVLPYKLNPSPLIYGLYYRGKLKSGTIGISSEWKSEEQLYIELKDMKEHGICCPTNYQRVSPKTSDESIEENIALFRQHMEIRKLAGLSNENLFYVGLLAGGESSLKSLDVFKKNIKIINELASEFGVKKVFFYGKEEQKVDGYSEQLPAWEVVRQNGGAIFVALDDRYFEDEQLAIPEIFVYHDEIDLEVSEKVKSLNSKILSYSNPQVGVENPALYRSNYGFSLIKNNFDGVMNYAYQDSMGTLWVDDDHKHYRDLAFVYPTIDGIVGTIAWEAFREAVDDTRYYYYALDLINKLDMPEREKYRIDLDRMMEDFDAGSSSSANKTRNKIVGLIGMIGGEPAELDY